jgi:hypothetical protein
LSAKASFAGARPETAQEWERQGAELLAAGKLREAVALYREAVIAQPAVKARVAAIVSQYRDRDLEFAFCLDPSDKGLAAAWAKSTAPRNSLCAESR